LKKKMDILICIIHVNNAIHILII